MADDEKAQYPRAIRGRAPANSHPRSDDQESANMLSEQELKRRKRMKIAMYIAIFVVFQVIVITAFGLTVMRVKSPKLRLSNIRLQSLETSTSSTSPSFNMSFITQVRIKNTNFGRYKFDNTTVFFTYQGTTVGEVVIPKGKAGLKSTKKMDVTVNLDSKALSTSAANLGSELSSEVLTLSSNAKMRGKVELMLIMKKNKSTDMNCTITFDVSAKTVPSLQCK